MTRRLFFVLIFSLVFSINTFAQKALPENSNLEQTKNWLKKNLVKEAGNIRKVEFNGCRMSVKQSDSGFFAQPSSGGFVGGGFPTDDSSHYFSAGPDKVFWKKTLKRNVTFELADLDLENIKTLPGWKKKSTIILQTIGAQNMVLLTLKDKTLNRPTFGITVKTKSAEKFVNAFRQAIQQCK
jgi:hypothetical protein